MALNCKTVSHNFQQFKERFDSKYYTFIETLSGKEKDQSVIVKPLGEFIEKITDGEHAGQKFVSKENGVLFLKNSSIKDFDISLYDGFYISKEKHESLARSALQEEDVLFTTIGHLGSATIVPKGFPPANMNQNFVKMKIDKDKISPYYLACFLNSKFVKKQLLYLFTGNIQSLISYPKLKSIKIVIPKKNEIVNEIEQSFIKALQLSKEAIDEIEIANSILRNELNNIKSGKKEICYSINYQTLTTSELWTPKCFYPQYVNTENEIKKTFQCVPLGEIVDLRDGDEVGSEEYQSYLDTNKSDCPFIRTSDIYNYQIDISPDFFVDEGIFNDLNQDLKKNDILYSKDGKIGEVGIITESDKCIISSGVEIMTLNKRGEELGLTSEYLLSCLAINEIGKYSADRYSVTASTIPHLKEDFIKRFQIPIIDSEKVKEITNIISKALVKIDTRKRIIKECQIKIDELCLKN